MTDNRPNFFFDIESYYTKKLVEHGPSPAGVDWNGEASQVLRFHQLTKILPLASEKCSVNDIGCGYGALLDFLAPVYRNLEYEGIDISAPMIAAAHERHSENPVAKFCLGDKPTAKRDFSIASGIFSVRLNITNELWLSYVKNTLDILYEYSEKGFSFNCLTTYSDRDQMRPDLYYADPLLIFDYCKIRYSRKVAILHDYDLYEFTILVRKS